MDHGISDDDDWPIRAIVVVIACLAGAVAALETLLVTLILIWDDESHGNLNPEASIVLRVAFYLVAPIALAAAIATWEWRWRPVVRMVAVLVAVLGAGGWYAITLHV